MTEISMKLDARILRINNDVERIKHESIFVHGNKTSPNLWNHVLICRMQVKAD